VLVKSDLKVCLLQTLIAAVAKLSAAVLLERKVQIRIM
jgi:hypothetical protein